MTTIDIVRTSALECKQNWKPILFISALVSGILVFFHFLLNSFSSFDTVQVFNSLFSKVPSTMPIVLYFLQGLLTLVTPMLITLPLLLVFLCPKETWVVDYKRCFWRIFAFYPILFLALIVVAAVLIFCCFKVFDVLYFSEFFAILFLCFFSLLSICAAIVLIPGALLLTYFFPTAVVAENLSFKEALLHCVNFFRENFVQTLWQCIKLTFLLFIPQMVVSLIVMIATQEIDFSSASQTISLFAVNIVMTPLSLKAFLQLYKSFSTDVKA